MSSGPLGIGIITYNRAVALQGCRERVAEYTTAPHRLVVADDGSADGSVAWARQQGLVVITGERRGCAWNKNRALYYLLERTQCDPILLLEDDCWPAEPGWEQPWVEAARRWGHVNCLYDLEGCAVVGSGTARDPYRAAHYTAQCTVTTRAALSAVGYLDTRFVGWGCEHVEWTRRFERLFRERWGTPGGTVPLLRSGLRLVPFGRWANAAEEARNAELMGRLANEPIWRPPWRDPDEEAVVRLEQAAEPKKSRGGGEESGRGGAKRP